MEATLNAVNMLSVRPQTADLQRELNFTPLFFVAEDLLQRRAKHGYLQESGSSTQLEGKVTTAS